MASRSTALARALENRNVLGLLFMLPAAVLRWFVVLLSVHAG